MHTGENLFKLYYLWKNFCYILSGKGTSVNSFILQSIPMYSWLKVNQQTHNRDKPFKCVLCEKAFTVSSDLSIHKRTHTGEKPYRCNLCEKAYWKKWKRYNLWKVLHYIFSISERNPFNVWSVRRYFLYLLNWIYIYKLMLEKKLLNVYSVKKHFVYLLNWKYIKWRKII